MFLRPLNWIASLNLALISCLFTWFGHAVLPWVRTSWRQDFKGAMVKQVAKGVYVGDPAGQAAEMGIGAGMVVGAPRAYGDDDRRS